MKVSHRWLQDYVKTNLTPVQLGDKFRLTSSEIEGMEEWGERFAGLVVGKVVSVAKHPNADKLRLAQVDIGTKELRHIVCGAPNLAEGQTVIVALPGVTLHPLKGEPFAIAEATIRGEKSEGMLCGADEIGLPMPSEGILVLNDSLAAGTSAAEALKLNDTVLDLEVTPNRPDLLSYVGLAREVAAFDKKTLLEPSLASGEVSPQSVDIQLSANIDDARLCLRYSVVSLSLSQAIGQSPDWMQARLLLSGIRPINAAVDITNYVMLEYGQPLHAFDLAKSGSGIRVRAAHSKETLTVLDGTERILESGDIVIADATDKPLAIAGIMGGLTSGINESSTDILLESAVFYGPQIRRTSRRLGLRSEASTRFEKGLDPELTITALKRALYLFKEICGAAPTSEIKDNYPGGHTERPRIHLSFARIQEILGVHISAPEAKGILQRLGFQVSSLTKSSFETTPPSWRRDVSLPEDVVEELVRIWGFERLTSSLPTGSVKAPEKSEFFAKKSLARRILAGLGMHECIHLTFASQADFTRLSLPTEEAIRLSNPLSSQTELLITTHALSLLGNLAGANLQEAEISLFEIGHVFKQPKQETEMLSLALRSGQDTENVYRLAKAAINRLAFQLRLPEPSYELAAGMSFMETGSALSIKIGPHEVGLLGAVSKETVSKLKIRSGRSIIYAELNLDTLLTLPTRQRLYVAPAAYPAIERDMTLIVAQDRPVGDIERLLAAETGSNSLSGWEITTIFSGKPLEADQKSVTIHFTYSSPERTLEDQAATADQARLVAVFQEKLGATLSQ